LSRPFFYIAANAGLNGETEVTKVRSRHEWLRLDARNGASFDLVKAASDPVKVCYSAVRNAASVAGLILTTQTMIAKKRTTMIQRGTGPGWRRRVTLSSQETTANAGNVETRGQGIL